MPPIKRGSVEVFLFSVVTGGVVFYDTLGYPTVQGQGFGQGPAFYPQVLAAALIVLGSLVLIQGFIQGPLSKQYEADHPTAGPRPRHGLVYSVFALAVASILAMKYTGFFIGGFVLAAATVFLIRRPRTVRAGFFDLIFSAGIITLVYLVFEVFIKVQLPRSILFH